MKKNLILIFIFFLSTACIQVVQDKYKCARTLTKQELESFKSEITKNYSDKYLDKLADITDQIAKCTMDTAEFEVFFNTKKNDFLAIDIYGFEIETQIDKIVCSLKENQELHLPSTTILLFHKYTKEHNNGGIVVGLKLK